MAEQTFYPLTMSANRGKKVKKSLITFIVALTLSTGFTFLSLVTRASLSVVLQSNIAESLSINVLLSIFFSLVGLAVFFVVFYFLAKNNKIIAIKSTIIAMLLGVTLGPAILDLFNIFLYPSYLGTYLNVALGSAVSSVFQFFFPALTVLLFVELKERKAKDSFSTSNAISTDEKGSQSAKSVG
jgi:hypothetical protein